jgi:hypothetical protein
MASFSVLEPSSALLIALPSICPGLEFLWSKNSSITPQGIAVNEPLKILRIIEELVLTRIFHRAGAENAEKHHAVRRGGRLAAPLVARIPPRRRGG